MFGIIGRKREEEKIEIPWFKPRIVYFPRQVKVARIIRRYSTAGRILGEVHGEIYDEASGQILRRILFKPKFPKMEWGQCKCDEPGWYRVYYSSRMEDPVVVAVAKVRGTTFIDRVVYRITPNEEELNNRVKERLGDWGMFNWMRDAVANGITKILMFVWDVLIMPQVDNIEARVNQVLRDLWAMVGLPVDRDLRNGISITFVNLANITDEYFDYLCLGDMEMYYLVVAKPE